MKRLFGRKSRNKVSTGKVIGAALAGSLLGATVALLMAPLSGQEMRRKLGRRVMDTREQVKTAAGNIESRARELVEEATGANPSMGKVSRGRKVASVEQVGE